MLTRLRSEAREMGWLGWTAYALDRTLARISRGKMRLWALAFYVQPVPRKPMLAPARNAKLRVGLVCAGELPASAFMRPPAAIDSRFREGSVCVAARSDGNLAGYMWLHSGRLRERMFACDFEALPTGRACWDYDFEIFPRYRLARTFARLWDEAFRLLRERGIENTVSWIHCSNLPSRRAHERMGAHQAGWLILLDIFGYRFGLQSNTPFLRFAGPSRRLHVTVQAAPAESRPERLGDEVVAEECAGKSSANLH